ncbi:MAG: hypothetical protein U9P72_12290 [Campylobacterota bacterium]|nr:hypothetical protein [Campylobacterota bacterium]
MPAQIYKLTLQDFKNQPYLKEIIYQNSSNDYYWSDDWSEEFYIELAKMGFISTTYDTKEGLVLLPELQFEYGILDFKNLHISKKVKKMMKENSFTLCFDTKFDSVIDKFSTQHKNNWLKDEYTQLVKNLYKNRDKTDNFKITSVELFSKDSDELVAGEIGYKIGKTYTSLSGFSLKEKKYNNCGNLQLILLAKYLEENDFDFWNLGHPHMIYKQKLGSITHSREEFLKRWQESTNCL